MPLPILFFLPAAGVAAGNTVYKKIKQHIQKKREYPGKSLTSPGSDQLPVKKETFTEAEINQDLAIASVSLGLTTAGMLAYPPLLILSVPALLYTTLPIFHSAYEAIFKRREVTAEAVYSISIPGIFLTGHIFIASLAAFFYFAGEKLLCRIREKTTRKLTDIFSEQPSTVWVMREGVEVEVPFETVRAGDIVVVRAGERIPADGRITEGMASVDQHILTGESQPLEKGVGEQVFASTVVLAGRIGVQVENSGSDTVVAQIGEVLNRTVDYKMSIESRGEEIANRLSLPTLAVGALALPVVGHVGALAVLTSGLGDDMRILGPISLLNHLRVASKNSLLVKDGRALELLAKVDTVVFDKTGTLTLEQPIVSETHPCPGHRAVEVLQYAAWAEYRQTHPIARAIVEKAEECELDLSAVDGARYEVGYGIEGRISGMTIHVGSPRFMEMEGIPIPGEVGTLMDTCHEAGHSLVMVARDRQLAGAIELHTAIRPEVRETLAQLRERDITTHIISGDHERPTRRLAEDLGMDHYFAEVFPEQKADIVGQLQREGRTVCFIGDGINDAIAMKKAQVSVSLRGASTVATDTANIILLDGTLEQVGRMFELAESLDKNVNVSLGTTLIPSMVNVGCVFLLHSGIIAALVLYNVGLAAGVTNTFLPLARLRGSLSEPPDDLPKKIPVRE